MESPKTGIDLILTILHDAKCEEIEGRRCFVVPLTEFFRCQYAMTDGGMSVRTDDRLVRTHSYENLQFRMSSLESQEYYICAKTEPLLDRLWEAKTGKKGK
jgi:hypothetical protein